MANPRRGRDRPRGPGYGQIAGHGEAQVSKGKIAFTHSEVEAAIKDRGLARQSPIAVADARRRGVAVWPFCPYVRKVIASSPVQYLALVPPPNRERFELPGEADLQGTDVQVIGDTKGQS